MELLKLTTEEYVHKPLKEEIPDMTESFKTLEIENSEYQKKLYEEDYKPMIRTMQTYTETDYLGHGAYALVIKVKDRAGKEWALKIQGEENERMVESMIGMFLYSGQKPISKHGYTGNQIPIMRTGEEFSVKEDDRLMGILDYYTVWRFDHPDEIQQVIDFLVKTDRMSEDDKEKALTVWSHIKSGRIIESADITDVSIVPESTEETPPFFSITLIELGELGDLDSWLDEKSKLDTLDEFIFYLEGAILQITANLVGLQLMRFVHGDLHLKNIFIQRFKKSSPESSLTYEFPGGKWFKWKDIDDEYTYVFVIGDFGYSGMDIIDEMAQIDSEYPHDTSYALDLHSLGMSIIFIIWRVFMSKRDVKVSEANSLIQILDFACKKFILVASDFKPEAEGIIVEKVEATVTGRRFSLPELFTNFHLMFENLTPRNIRDKFQKLTMDFFRVARWFPRGSIAFTPKSQFTDFWNHKIFDKFTVERIASPPKKKESPPKKPKLTRARAKNTNEDVIPLLKKLIVTVDEDLITW